MNCKLSPPLSIYEIGQRTNQEDAIAQWDKRLFVLCDGMGGHEKGEVASQTVCQSLVKWFQENITDNNFSDERLREAIEFAYTELDKYADDSLKQMGTTLTLLYIHKQGATAAHIGDSRIYHIRPGVGVLYQSRDHSLVFDLFQAGEITYEEMQNYPQKNVITRAMTPGTNNRHRADIIHITDIQAGDFFYLCSDGMLEQMKNEEIVSLLSSNSTDEEKRQQLITATNNNHDNHSAWLIHVEEVVEEEGDNQLKNEEPTARCNAINIMPTANNKVDVQITNNDNDVVVVSSPQTPKKKRIPFLKWMIAAILFLFIVGAACFVLFDDDKKIDEEKENTEQMMRNPIKPFQENKKSIEASMIETNNVNSNDTARNQ